MYLHMSMYFFLISFLAMYFFLYLLWTWKNILMCVIFITLFNFFFQIYAS